MISLTTSLKPFNLHSWSFATFDAVKDDHKSISNAEKIGDAIITRMQDEFKLLGFIIDSVDDLTVRKFSDDSVAGFRLKYLAG